MFGAIPFDKQTRIAVTWMALALVSGCQPISGTLGNPHFQLAPPPDLRVAAPGLGPFAQSPQIGTGTLTISLKGAFARPRGVLATLADVQEVVVTVVVSGQTFSRAILGTVIQNGQTTATFTGLPVGSATVTMTAYDVSHASIGQASQTATVTANQTTTVDLSVTLAPTYQAPASGGGSGSDPTGNLVTNGTLLPGPTIFGTADASVPTSLETFALDPTLDPEGVVTDRDGDAWVMLFGGNADATTSRIQRFDPTGAMVLDVERPFGTAAADPNGGIYVTSDHNGHLSPAGVWAPTDSTNNCSALAVGADGNAWSIRFDSPTFYQFGPDGAALATFDVQTPVLMGGGLAIDHSGNFWYSDYGDLIEVNASGVRLKLIAKPADAQGGSMTIKIDGRGNTWWVDDATPGLYRLGASGGAQLVDPLGNSLAIGPDGDVWSCSGATTRRYAPDGTRLATYPGGGNPSHYRGAGCWLSVDSAGKVWYLSATHQLVKLTP